MRRTFICLLALVAVASACASAGATTTTEITSSGSASVSLPPDVATVIAAVRTNSENASDAVSQNNAVYDRIVAAVTRLGIARGDITLTFYSVHYNPKPSVPPANPPDEPYGYTVYRNFAVKVRAIERAGAVSDACVAAGATEINGVQFGLSDPDVARAAAIEKATEAARRIAQAMARAAGLRIVGIKSITLGGGIEPAPMMRTIANVRPATEFDQSNVNVTVSVSVVFLAAP